jgi:phosphohistidine phosphatase
MAKNDPLMTRTFRIKKMPSLQLIMIRHAIAEDREEFARTGEPDDKRPLTKGGIRRMERIVVGLKQIVPKIDVVATSPLTRATQTADIIGNAFRVSGAEVIPALLPGAKPEDFASWARNYTRKGVVAAIGHEPYLGSLVTWLIGGKGESRVELKKGGACLIEFDDAVGPGLATMCWLATPRMLRRLGS